LTLTVMNGPEYARIWHIHANVLAVAGDGAGPFCSAYSAVPAPEYKRSEDKGLHSAPETDPQGEHHLALALQPEVLPEPGLQPAATPADRR